MEREAKKTPAPEGENWLEQYTCLVLTGKITACRKVRTLCAVLLDKLRHPEKYRPWVFDEALANHHIEFVERFCKQPQGKLGAPLRLELFQKARWQAIFGFVDAHTGLRQYQECMIVEGRKNGKTTECAGIEIDLLANDGEGAPEIYSIATKREQAAKSFNACVNMRKQSPELAAAIRKRQSDLYYPYNLGFITALASATNTLDGLNAHGVLVDELAAIKNRAIYDDMKQSMSAREQPLLFSISTKHDGYKYRFSPYAMIWNRDCYYAVGWSEKHGKIAQFRVDRMTAVQTLDFDPAEYVRKVFGMYPDNLCTVELLCDNEVMRSVIDRFGENVWTETVDEQHFRATVEVAPSPPFFSWVFTFSGKIRIVSPAAVLEEMRDMAAWLK